MRDSDEDADTLASRQPRQPVGFWSRAAEGFARIFGFGITAISLHSTLGCVPPQLLTWIAVGIVASDISSAHTTAAAPEDDGNNGQLVQSEEAATEEKVKPLEDQGLFDPSGSVCIVLSADNRW